MMKCPFCGNRIEEDDLFCPICGNKVEKQVTMKGAEGGYCPYCGAFNGAGSTFCTSCGKQLVSDEMPMSYDFSMDEEPKQEDGWLKALILVAVVLFITVAMGIGAYWFLTKDGGTKEESVEIEEQQKEDASDEEDELSAVEKEEKAKEEAEKKAEEAEERAEEAEKKAQEAEKKAQEAEKKAEEAKKKENTAGYILPQSSSTLLTSQEIASLSLKELNYARNEIFARHGRKFASQELQNYFNSKSWYKGTIEPADFDANYMGNLSSVEKSNIELLKTEEYARSSSGYKLDQ